MAPSPPRTKEPAVVIVPNPVIADAGPDESDELAAKQPIPPRFHEPRRRAEAIPHDAGADAASESRQAAPAPRAIVVPAAAVVRALERRDVGAANAITSDGTAVGARLVGVGKYGTGLEDGDIVVSVNGVRTRTVDAMVSAAMAGVRGGATQISGRVIRGDATIGVILEVPPR
ncbi:MAG: hypothetical protein JST00_27150 [Deltaproteobacteria bacterium]|nr:hypothetical protein [Deltaproteobacteria bacterium]